MMRIRGALAVLLALAGCDDAQRGRRSAPFGGAVTVPYVQTAGFQAGEYVAPLRVANPYRGQEARGEEYYLAMNCHGCHGAAGGGGIGPPFLVPEFIYGSQPANIFQSIVQGRPQGMPAYGGKISDEVVWKIVAYVESLAAPHLVERPWVAGGAQPGAAGNR
jgi:cytochrome c oxidase cbb3-type subunit III